MKEEHKIITAGPVVTLPCQPPNDRSILAVEWTRADLGYKYVVLYRAGHFDSVIGFKNRVDLQQGNIINLSVVDPPGQPGGQSGDGVNEDGFVGLRAGLPLPVMFIIAGVFLIYRKHKKRRRHGLYYHV
ncbi:uncharacterized protein LOC102292361 isoform X3 [Haplochromis burtoni]|uniref:uncharacterized protein LOC102292361 isoform X3 n=1 Tax=Haplochromis burtoni TaxID=8153 RepID=UPI001C2D8333|nr:uncharacterized protein LOC102292361 isoform X3 [Haplochromis burtoni]